jgi:hypothetical protein
MANLTWAEQGPFVGVDSGQAGIFDASNYRNDNVIVGMPENAHICGKLDKFYGACCDVTLGDVGAGVIPFGFVSSSGWGDGGYESFIASCFQIFN